MTKSLYVKLSLAIAASLMVFLIPSIPTFSVAGAMVGTIVVMQLPRSQTSIPSLIAMVASTAIGALVGVVLT